MEEVFDFLNGEEIEDFPTPDEEFVEWEDVPPVQMSFADFPEVMPE